MKLGTQIKLKDGRVGTIVYNSLIGEGIKWGLHNPDPADFEGTDGNTVSVDSPPDWQWEPDALLRDPWDGCEKCGFTSEQCVGNEYEIIRNGTDTLIDKKIKDENCEILRSSLLNIQVCSKLSEEETLEWLILEDKMFAKKHYIAIAKALREIDSSFFDHDTLNEVVESLCKLFKKDNEKFNEAKFIKAIGE